MKKTIVIIHPHFTIMGGAGRVMLELGKRLSKNYKIIAISQQANLSTIHEYPEISFHSTSGPTTDRFCFWLLFPYWQLKTYLLIKKYIQPDSPIFVSVFPSNWIVFPFKLFFKENKLIWFCQEPSGLIQDKNLVNSIMNPFKKFIALIFNPLFKILDLYLTKIPDQIIANSQFSQQRIMSVYKQKSTVIYPGIDTNIFKPIPYPQKENYILYVGRLNKFKRVDVLVNAFAKLSKTIYRLKIVGNGEELQNLQELCKQLNISGKVDFMTNVSDKDIVPIFQKAKLFVLCSKNEPFGIVPIEAMACGTPVICDNSGGPRETVVDGFTGTLINNIDPNKLSKHLGLPESEIQKYSSYCHKHVKSKYAWQHTLDKILKEI